MVHDSQPPRGDRSRRAQVSGNRVQWLLFAVGGLLFLGAVLVVAGAPGALLDGPLADDGDVSPATPGTDTPGADGTEGGDGGTDGESTATATATGTEASASVVYRVNVGGPELEADDDGPDWSADREGDPSEYLNADESDTVAHDTPDEITVEDDVPSRVPEEMFKTYRFERGADQEEYEEMTWRFPVEPDRTYEVRLYIMEPFFVEGDSGRDYERSYEEYGPRSFGVAIENETVMENYEPFEEHGHDVGAVHTFEVTPDDDALTIRFLREVENPTVSGIEIVAVGSDDGDDGDS